MRIALFGGKFDPPHLAHLEITKHILQTQLVDQLWFLPANTHPWRNIHVSPEHRLKMLSFMENRNIKICDIEIVRGGQTYTIDTIRQLQQTTPHSFYWVNGTDQAEQLPKWKEFEELKKRMKFLMIPRNNILFSNTTISYQILQPLKLYKSYSSTLIRNAIKEKKSIDSFVLPEVKEYIQNNKLYGYA